MSFLFGFLGALALTALLGLGFACGWLGHRALLRYTAPAPVQPGEEERRALKEQQQAFQMLQNYSTERAYGLLEEVGGENT